MRFWTLRDPQSSQRNESATIFLAFARNGREFPIVIRQIAGLIARRIVTDLSPGEQISRSQRIGMIKFGSRMESLVPAELSPRVLVEVGRHVQAGYTPLVEVSP